MSVDIALYLPDMKGGGAEYVMVQLANGFAAKGLRVDLVLDRARGPNLERRLPAVRLVDFAAANTYTAFPKLLRYLREEEPRIMLSTLNLNNLTSLFARRMTNASTKVYVRAANTDSIQYRPPIKKMMERFLLSRFYPWADGVICVSKGVADDLAGFTGMHRSRMQVIYNPAITPEVARMASKPIDDPWFGPKAIPVILGVGRLAESKGFASLIRAYDSIRKSHPSKLVILGEGEERPKLESLIRELGLTSDVSLPGFVDNPYAYMRKSAVFVLSSLWEGLPNALIQALSVGAPVVSTDCPSGPSEILDGGKYGHLVPVENVPALAEAIEAALDGDKRSATPEWLKQFTAETIVDQYLAVMV
jgi:glycosyltransferase involved in cell wall biosynthesis